MKPCPSERGMFLEDDVVVAQDHRRIAKPTNGRRQAEGSEAGVVEGPGCHAG
jgi:hypothetical protein